MALLILVKFLTNLAWKSISSKKTAAVMVLTVMLFSIIYFPFSFQPIAKASPRSDPSEGALIVGTERTSSQTNLAS